MENVAMQALQTDPVQLFVLGMGMMAIAVVLLAFFNSRANNRLVGVMSDQVRTNGDLTQATIRQTDALRTEQELRRDLISATNRLNETIDRHIGQVDQQHTTIVETLEQEAQASVKRFEALQTNLVGETGKLIDQSVEKLAAELTKALTPLNENIGIIRTGLERVEQRREEEQIRRQEEDARYKADLNAIWDKAAETQQKLKQAVEDTIKKFLGGHHEDPTQHIVADQPDTLPHADFSGAASGSAGDKPTDKSDDSSGISAERTA